MEFSAELVASLKLPQASYSGDLTDGKTRQNISLRAAAPGDWHDARTTKPYFWNYPVGGVNADDGDLHVWPKPIVDGQSTIANMLQGQGPLPFVANAEPGHSHSHELAIHVQVTSRSGQVVQITRRVCD